MPQRNTQAVLEHHLAALLAGDVEGLMEDYSDESLFISNLDGMVKGSDSIRSMHARGADMSGWQLLVTHVEGDVAYVSWKVEGSSSVATPSSYATARSCCRPRTSASFRPQRTAQGRASTGPVPRFT